MADVSIDLNTIGIREVLAGLRFPASRWQIVAHAQHWGATPRCITELTQLPVRDYHSLPDIVGALGRQRAPMPPTFPRPPRPAR